MLCSVRAVQVRSLRKRAFIADSLGFLNRRNAVRGVASRFSHNYNNHYGIQDLYPLFTKNSS